MKVLVIVPAFNEEKNISGVIADLRTNFPAGDVLVVDDGSCDGTAAAAKAFGVPVLKLSYNLGIGGAIQAGLSYALREGYGPAIQFDGDGQHRAEEIPKMLAAYQNGADLVIGTRFLHEGDYASSLQRTIGRKILSFIVSVLIGKKITDCTSGFRIYGKKAIELFSEYYPEDYPEVEAIILAHKKRLSMKEVSVRMRPRSGGRSSINTPRAAYYMIKVILAVLIGLLRG